MINQLTSNPRKVFLLDGFGAVLSAFSLGIILIQFESWFGMPKEKLVYLAAVAVVFSIYSFICYFRFPNNWRLFLAIIATSNFIYSLVTLRLIFLLYQELTLLGLTYFILELIILMVLIWIEFLTIRNH
jgi:hypothetical protein